ncbi:MAG: hypothetical protein HUJ29_02945 [Gammaproteobacteria bacterium]|nr:hypothetical protein [Gammaproteobacteria bacterium]
MQAYRLITLQKTYDVPNIVTRQGKWYRYIISNGISEITGYRCGKMGEVKSYLDSTIRRLNQKYDLKQASPAFNKSFVKPCYSSETPLS